MYILSLETILLLQERLKHTIIIKQNTCVEFFSVIRTCNIGWKNSQYILIFYTCGVL